MDTGPNQTAVGVDVDLGHTEFGSLLELTCIHTLGAFELAAGGINAPDFFLTTLPMAIAEKGYYVFPVNMVKNSMEAGDITCNDFNTSRPKF